jgi:hypothetical protein
LPQSRARLHRFSWIALMLMFSMQGAFAMSAGYMFSARAQQRDVAANEAVPSCHGTTNSDPGRTLCHAHCLTDAQALTQFDVPFLPSCLEAAPILALRALPATNRPVPCSWRDVSSTDPPISIRFCSFLI